MLVLYGSTITGTQQGGPITQSLAPFYIWSSRLGALSVSTDTDLVIIDIHQSTGPEADLLVVVSQISENQWESWYRKGRITLVGQIPTNTDLGRDT